MKTMNYEEACFEKDEKQKYVTDAGTRRTTAMNRLVFFIPLCLVLLFMSCHDEKMYGEDDNTAVRSSGASGKAFAINEKLKRGINMGNTFDAPTESEWGNPWKPEYFKMMADIGFNHVRLPVRWETNARSMPNAPYTITPAFLERIRTVVDEALKNNLYIIINMHHHEALMQNPAGQKARFLAQWKQIAEYFQSYSDMVLFEILNEPQSNLTAQLWNEYLDEALKVIRKSNPDRIVLIGDRGLESLQLPDDENIILTVHYYNPFEFTHQGADFLSYMEKWIGTKWNDTEYERKAIREDFKKVKNFAQQYNVPVHVGEFGTYYKADMDSRVRWTTYITRYMEQLGFSWAYWEFSSSFGIYDLEKKELITPLVDALTKNKMPQVTPTEHIPVFYSNFSPDNPDRWAFYYGNLDVSHKQATGEYIMYIRETGNNAWDIQLIKYGIPLKKGQRYRLSFLASASADCSIMAYAGLNGNPWTQYGVGSFQVGQTETLCGFNFTMLNNNDTQARIVFDLGKTQARLTLKNLKLNIINY